MGKTDQKPRVWGTMESRSVTDRRPLAWTCPASTQSCVLSGWALWETQADLPTCRHRPRSSPCQRHLPSHLCRRHSPPRPLAHSPPCFMEISLQDPKAQSQRCQDLPATDGRVAGARSGGHRTRAGGGDSGSTDSEWSHWPAHTGPALVGIISSQHIFSFKGPN